MVQWEYAVINYAQESDMRTPGQMMWTAQIKWPGAERLDIRDRVNIHDVLNELGAQGWELIAEVPAPGINARNYRLKRQC